MGELIMHKIYAQNLGGLDLPPPEFAPAKPSRTVTVLFGLWICV